MTLNPFGYVTSSQIVKAAESFGTPFYIYDEALIIERCQRYCGCPMPTDSRFDLR